ncbi:MAG: cytochrome C oxidase subunit IV family protein [Deltaproteobacteria bacterium]|nr:cytochrome C oxidase subunit IV family protein [Deltaproteobacteria bacterium]
MNTHAHAEKHIIGFKIFFLVWLTLTILTAITIWVSYIDFGLLNIVIALTIASIKAGLVALFFMHLKYEDKVTWIFVLYPLGLLALLIGLNISDVFYRVTP